ncbi:hypothetical protein L7F22_018665 [Adiantum nelumboides]|nr:hypothetical protein [Adiantum nelumboides]
MGSLSHFPELNPMHGSSFADATRGVSSGVYNPLFKAPSQHETGIFFPPSNFVAPWDLKEPFGTEHQIVKHNGTFPSNTEAVPIPRQDLPGTGHNPNGLSDSLDPASPKQLISEGIAITEEDLTAWHNQLNERVVLGLSHGPRPSMEVLKQLIAFNWENRNVFPQHIQYLPNNYYLFFFEDANSALQVITEGQCLIKNTPISFFKWHKGFNPRGAKPTRVPVWVDFLDLPVEFYPWLGKLGNSLGKVFGQKFRGGINPKWDPQLLIEVDLSKPTKISIPITNMSRLFLHDQKIVYRNLPNSCYHCFQQGHMIKDCHVKLAKQEAKAPHGGTLQPSNQDFQTVTKGASKPLKKKQQQFNPNRKYFGVLLEEFYSLILCVLVSFQILYSDSRTANWQLEIFRFWLLAISGLVNHWFLVSSVPVLVSLSSLVSSGQCRLVSGSDSADLVLVSLRTELWVTQDWLITGFWLVSEQNWSVLDSVQVVTELVTGQYWTLVMPLAARSRCLASSGMTSAALAHIDPLNVPSEGTKDFPDLDARQDFSSKEAGIDTDAVKEHN